MNHLPFWNDCNLMVSDPSLEGNHLDIPDHYCLSLNRLRYLQPKLFKLPQLLEEYN